MTIGVGVYGQVRFKKETTWGTLAGTSAGAQLRRKTCSIDLSKQTAQSGEITTTQQLTDFRHGAHQVGGDLVGELAPGSYSAFMQSALRRDFSTVAAASSLTLTCATSTVSNPVGQAYTLVRSAGSFLADGFKSGMVMRMTAGSVIGTNINMFILGFSGTSTATVLAGQGGTLTVGTGTGCTLAPTGKVTYTPPTGQTADSYTIERWFSDVAVSRVYTGCRITGMALNFQPQGMAEATFSVMGKTIGASGTAAYFTAPSAANTIGVLTGVNGVCQLAGTVVGVLTGLSIKLDGNGSVAQVVGSNFTPDVFMGRVIVTGQATALFQDATLLDAFLNETTSSISGVFYTGSGPTADFVAVTLAALKFGAATIDDGEKGLVVTAPFTALYNASGGAGTATEQTTLWVQDSQAA